MNDKFYELSKEKQDRMINGCMKVFAINGYKKASTDDMVKMTGVSKGLWFHYFGSKLGLYTFVCSYAVRFAMLELSMKDEGLERNYFINKRNVEEVKVLLAEKYPYLPLLLKSMENEKDEEAVEQIDSIRNQYLDAIKEKTSRTYAATFGDDNWALSLDYMLDATFEKLLREQYNLPVFSGEDYMKNVNQILTLTEELVMSRL